jgi:hypothetical protein
LSSIPSISILRNQAILSVMPSHIKKSFRPDEDERITFAVPPQFTGNYSGALSPRQAVYQTYRGCAVSGSPVPVYSGNTVSSAP